MLVIENARVVAELVLDEDSESLAMVLAALAAEPITVAQLASSLECQTDDVQFLLDRLSQRGWVG